MSSLGFPVLVVGVLLAGTAAAIVITPRDLLRSTVVTAPSPYLADVGAPDMQRPTVFADVPVVQVASMTVEVTPLSDTAAAAPSPTLVPAAPIVQAEQAPAGKDLRRITAGVLNMRSEPNKYAELLASLPRDTVVSVLETSGTWAYVTAPDGTSGWLSQNFLAAAQE